MGNTNIAYLLVCHKNPEQVNMFIDQLLEYGDCDIYIHVDSKNKAMMSKITSNDSVKLYSEYDVKWGSFEIVLAGLMLMKRALESGNGYTHFYFGSAQDLLVKKGMYEYLELTNKSVYIHIVGEINNRSRAAAKYLVKWPHKLMIRNDYHLYRFVRIALQCMCAIGLNLFPNKKKLKRDIVFYEGRTWFIAKKEMIEYIVDYCKENPDYVDLWTDSLASDLMFFQTLIMNSPYSSNIEDELMYVRFGKTFGTMNHPVPITKDSMIEIEKGNYFCARKFNYPDDIEIMEYYINRTRSNVNENKH